MSLTSLQNSSDAIDILRSQYADKVDEEDPLGREAFMTMLVAQLKHQDPLNPMDGTDFSAQLAQFTSLEQSMNMNESLEEMLGIMNGQNNVANSLDYVGKVVTGESTSIEVEGGVANGGYFTLNETGDAYVTIYNSYGESVKSLYMGSNDPGSYIIDWDGTDDAGQMVNDGSYSYEVFTKTSQGVMMPLETKLTGEVTGIEYIGGKSFLVIGGVLVDPDTVSKVESVTAEVEE